MINTNKRKVQGYSVDQDIQKKQKKQQSNYQIDNSQQSLNHLHQANIQTHSHIKQQSAINQNQKSKKKKKQVKVSNKQKIDETSYQQRQDKANDRAKRNKESVENLHFIKANEQLSDVLRNIEQIESVLTLQEYCQQSTNADIQTNRFMEQTLIVEPKYEDGIMFFNVNEIYDQYLLKVSKKKQKYESFLKQFEEKLGQNEQSGLENKNIGMIQEFKDKFIMREIKERIENLQKFNYVIKMGIQILWDRMKGYQKQYGSYIQLQGLNEYSQDSLNLVLKELQNRDIKRVFDQIGVKCFLDLLLNKIMLIKSNGNYIQLLGFSLDLILQNRQIKCNRRVYYSKLKQAYRNQLFYCEYFCRKPGIFNQNVFNLIKTKSFDMIWNTVINRRESITYGLDLNQKQRQLVEQLFQQFLINFHEIDFNKLLAKYCRLPRTYQEMKKRIMEFIRQDKSDDSCEEIYEKLFKETVNNDQVYRFLKAVCDIVIPVSFVG